MDVFELMCSYNKANPNGHFFDSATLKFFGETLATMRVLKNLICIKESTGEVHVCYVLSKRSKKFDGSYFRNYAYFDKDTFQHIIPDNE